MRVGAGVRRVAVPGVAVPADEAHRAGQLAGAAGRGAALAPAEIVREPAQQRPVAARAGRQIGRQAERVLAALLVAAEREAGGHGQPVAAHQQLDVGNDPRVAA